MESAATPRDLQIGDERPPAIRALRRRKKCLNVSRNNFGPHAITEIPFDTGDAGSFVIPNTLRLEGTVTIKNANPFIDYISLGRAGWNQLIETMSWEVNGTALERVRHYSTVSEILKIREGTFQDPFFLSFRNTWEAAGGAAGDLHINFIKPPMVAANGKPWRAQGIAERNPEKGEAFVYPVGSSGYAPKVYTHASTDTTTTLQSAGNFPSMNYWARLSSHENTAVALGTYSTGAAYSSGGIDGSVAPVLYVSVKDGSLMGGPHYCPVNMDKLREEVKKNHQQRTDLNRVLNAMSNVKYIPVHKRLSAAQAGTTVEGSLKAHISNKLADGNTLDADFLTVYTETPYRFSLELDMALVGRFARKWFPTSLVGAGRMSLRIEWADATRAFRVSMDPCDRIPGTVRDCCPYKGVGSTSKTVKHIFADGEDLMLAYCGAFTRPSFGLFAEAFDGNYTVASTDSLTSLNTAAALGRAPQVMLPPLGISESSESIAVGDNSLDAIMTHPDQIGAWKISARDAAAYAYAKLYGDITASKAVWGGENYFYIPPGDLSRTGAISSPFMAPLCQYVPYTDPQAARRSSTNGNGHVDVYNIGEEHLCYGTYLERSRPQSRRCTPQAYPLEIPTQKYGTYGITYEVSNLQLVMTEILVPDATMDGLLREAIAGNAIMEMTIHKSAENQLPKLARQNILIPIPGASIISLTSVFRPMEQITGSNMLVYDYNSFVNPFVTIDAPVTNKLCDFDSPLKVRTPFDANLENCGIELYYQLGSDLYPRQPIDSLYTLLQFMMEGDKIIRGEGELGNFRQRGGYPEWVELCTEMVPHTQTGSGYMMDVLKDGYFAPWTPVNILSDQTLTENPFMKAQIRQDPADVTNNKRGAYSSGLFEPLCGTFHLSLLLSTFPGYQHKARDGSTVVNNSLYLRLSNAYALEKDNFQMFTMAELNAKVVFERGGSMSLIS